MAKRRYQIEMNVVTTQAEASANRLKEHFKAVEAAIAKSADQTERAAERKARADEKYIDGLLKGMARYDAQWKKSLTEEEIARKVMNQKIINANNARIEAAMKAADVEYKGAKNGWEGVDRLMGSVKALALSYVGLEAGVKMLGAIGEAAREAALAQTKYTDEFLKFRDAQRELMGMSGAPMTTANVLKNAQFAAEVGLDQDKARGFREQFSGSGVQFRGKNMAAADYARFETMSATYAASQGIDPTVMGNLAGKIVGSRDYTKEKDPAAAALGDLNQAFKVLQKGSGSNASLVKNLSTLSSFAQNPDQLMGTFNSWRESAVAISTSAEINPEESETMTRAAIKALRPDAADKKHQELLAKAGVTPQMKFFDAWAKLAPFVRDEAKRTNVDVGQVLQSYGLNRLEGVAAGAFINKGVFGGVIADRMAEADANARPEIAQGILRDALTNPEGPVVHTRSVEGRKLAEIQQGAARAATATLMEQAQARMVATGAGTSTVGETAWDETVGRIGSRFGVMPALEQRRTSMMANIIEERARVQGIRLRSPAEAYRESGVNLDDMSSSAGRDTYMGYRAQEFQAQGGNILVDLTREMVDELRKANAPKGPMPVNAGPVPGPGRP